MKRIFITILSLIFFVYSFAQVTGTEVSMVSYEQAWRDSYGTLALKNNTKEQIHNVAFLITYYDMSGNEVDYKEYTREVEIAPGMTRKVDIPAYEHSRSYHYYKSDGLYDNTSFKIKFSLTDFNLTEENLDDDVDDSYEESSSNYRSNYSRDDDSPSPGMILLILAIILICLGFVVGMYVLVAVMAQKRKRNVVIWILLSIVTTPILMAIILLVIGDADKDHNDSYTR